MGNKVSGTWSDGKKMIDVNLQIIIFTEDDTHIIFCPALNLTGYGETEAEAMESFKTVLHEYFTYTNNKDTLAKDLRMMGWEIKKNLKKPATPPAMSQLLNTNDDFKNIFDNYDYKKMNTSISMPVLA